MEICDIFSILSTRGGTLPTVVYGSLAEELNIIQFFEIFEIWFSFT